MNIPHELLCVGGPLHGQRIATPGGLVGGVLMIPIRTENCAALRHGYEPGELLRHEEGMYRVEQLAFETPRREASVSLWILAYYGRGMQDRPARFIR